MDQTRQLNDQLTKASKKFHKSIKQIKLVRQQIVQLASLFAYCDEEINLAIVQQQQYVLNSDNDDQVAAETSIERLSRRRNHLNAFKESIRQQIENLQCIKTAFLIYADRKADDIFKIQVDLFGEERVRQAYEQATDNGHLLVDISAPTTEQQHQQQQQLIVDQPSSGSTNWYSTSTEPQLSENLISA